MGPHCGGRALPCRPLASFYKEAKKRFDENEEFKKEAQLTVVRLQSLD